MHDREYYLMLDKYHAAIYYSKRDPNEFARRFGQTLHEYRATDECKRAHKTVQRFARGSKMAKRG